MAKLSNTSKGDYGLPCGVMVAAGQTVEVDDEVLDNDLHNIVVKAWLKQAEDGKGGLVLGDYVPPDEEESVVEAGDGLDKLSKADLIVKADELDLDFDEKKATKANLIELIRAAPPKVADPAV